MTALAIIFIVLGIALPLISRFIPWRRQRIRLLIGGPVLVIIGILMLTGVIEQ